ncbi:MAG: ubiquinone/menaquinone biosynthesis methyltransferase, partial [Treponema sp.]|nr:ubiquinone/menaquinone biosynthesis methyltransferase [Treponema sp.]
MIYDGEGKAVYVQKTFNAIAPKYDLMNKIMSMGMDEGWRKLAVKQVNAQPGMHILDVCCGTGRLTLALNKAVGEEGAVIGLDFSENMIAIAEQTFREMAIKGNVQFVRGDAMNLPFPDNSFDGAIVGWGLRNLSDLRQGIRELARVVKPGGRVVSLDMA